MSAVKHEAVRSRPGLIELRLNDYLHGMVFRTAAGDWSWLCQQMVERGSCPGEGMGFESDAEAWAEFLVHEAAVHPHAEETEAAIVSLDWYRRSRGVN